VLAIAERKRQLKRVEGYVQRNLGALPSKNPDEAVQRVERRRYWIAGLAGDGLSVFRRDDESKFYPFGCTESSTLLSCRPPLA
jgi:hypothetical protein